MIETNSGTVIVSVDRKIVQEAFKNLKASKDLLATVAQSPDFPKELSEQDVKCSYCEVIIRER